MASRHLGRSIVLQSLYEYDFYGDRNPEKFKKIFERNLENLGEGLDEDGKNFTKKLAEGIIKNWNKLNEIISKVAPRWPLSQINIIDRNALRIGLYELIYQNKKEVPPKVAINEAVELAKNFSSETAGKFVNGVLGTVYREIEKKEKK